MVTKEQYYDDRIVGNAKDVEKTLREWADWFEEGHDKSTKFTVSLAIRYKLKG
jgi:hypothetical protein